MGRDRRKSGNLKRDEAKLEAEVLSVVRRFVKKQRRKGIKVQYLNFLWDGERYPRLATEYGQNARPVAEAPPLPLTVEVTEENVPTVEAESGTFPIANSPDPGAVFVTGRNQLNVVNLYDWKVIKV